MKFKTVDRETLFLMPPSVDDWLPAKHPARFLVDVLDQLDLSEIEMSYSSHGRAAYPVRTLYGIIFYGYMTGVFSSRKLEKATYESVAFRFIAGNLHPDHDTIANFRTRFLKDMDSVFNQIMLIGARMGVLKLKNAANDGSKILANASKHKALSSDYLKKLEALVRQELDQLHKMAEEAENIPEDMDIPEELERRETRLAVIEATKAEIEKRAQERYEAEKAEYEEKVKQRETYEKQTGKKKAGKVPSAPTPGPRKHDQVNLTDKESRIMPKSGGGFVQAYNAQITVDVDSHLIITSHVTQHTNDKLEIEPTLEELKKIELMLDQKVECLLSDAGYYSEKNVQLCEEANIKPLIADKRDKHNRSLTSRFDYIDPAKIPHNADPVTKMKLLRQTKEGKELYAKRKATVEPVFGIIKHAIGFRQFSLRGYEKVVGEWKIVCASWNLKRMYTLITNPKPTEESEVFQQLRPIESIDLKGASMKLGRRLLALGRNIIIFASANIGQNAFKNSCLS